MSRILINRSFLSPLETVRQALICTKNGIREIDIVLLYQKHFRVIGTNLALVSSMQLKQQ